MIKSIHYSKIITEDLLLYGAEDAYRALIAKNIVPMMDEEGAIVAFEPIGHMRTPELTTFTGKFANLKNELDAIFEDNYLDYTDPKVFAILKRYFDMLDCNRKANAPAKNDWKDLFHRIQNAPTIDDCRKFDEQACGTNDAEFIAAAMTVDTIARKLFGDDYLTRNNQVEEAFEVEWDA